ncbi:hypothetical protein KC333_g130 [Hortaea werneckii]|nr:hypothetical protein KC333_g130 [Hortaea werneckii]
MQRSATASHRSSLEKWLGDHSAKSSPASLGRFLWTLLLLADAPMRRAEHQPYSEVLLRRSIPLQSLPRPLATVSLAVADGPLRSSIRKLTLHPCG